MTIRLDIGHYLPIDDLLQQRLFLQPFSRYWPIRALGSRPWHFRVTWRHRSRDHLIPRWPFPIDAPLSPSRYLNQSIFETIGTKHIEVTTLTFQGHVTWRHRSRDHSIPRGLFPIHSFIPFYFRPLAHKQKKIQKTQRITHRETQIKLMNYENC